MRTLVFQSYRPTGVPQAIARSLAGVRQWAGSRGHDYRLIDDRFFDVVPAWYRERVGANKPVLANLARLCVARDALAEGYERAIWIDADVVVFDPGAFEVTTADGFALCRETWITRRGADLAGFFRVNNAVCAFDRGNRFLDFAIWAHETLVRDRPELVQAHGTSTALLTEMYVATPMPLLHGIGIFTPAMVRELAEHGDGPAVRMFATRHRHPIQAANLTYSMVGVPHDGVVATAEHYDAAVERVIATRGAAFADAQAHPAPVSSAQSRGTR